MPNLNETSLDPRHQSLLEAKFGKLWKWTNPQIVKSVGPFDPTVFDMYEVRRDFLISEAQRVLDEFSAFDLQVLADSNLPDPDGRRDAWSSFL